MIAALYTGINYIIFHLLSDDDVDDFKDAEKIYKKII